MKTSTKYIFLLLRLITILLALGLALSLESPRPQRLKMLLSLFILLIVSIHGKECKGIKSSKFYPLFFLVDILLLFIIESQSKFLLNYYMHFVYFILLFSTGIQLPRIKGTLINAITFVLSMVKFYKLLQIHFSPANLSLAIFSFFTALLSIIIINYAKHQAEEREKIKGLYEELRSYGSKLRELTIIEERNRIAMEIHDGVGHRMTGLIMALEMSKRLLHKDLTKVEELLQHATDTARQALTDLRKAVDALKEDFPPQMHAIHRIGEMVQHFELQTGLKIHLSINPSQIQLPRVVAEAAYRIIQEALTNTAKHSNATEIFIGIEVRKKTLFLEIRDNGTASEAFQEGNGLQGMRMRLGNLGGKISFFLTSGFHIKAEVPLSSSHADSKERGDYYAKN
ncbi:Signal transduction histidine kinase [Geosporobacter subterraneus DSM 17957]|uniref:histidine kinase n=1 Tax=Geosporobacter subterraneus DSM 17957 TaxID=1121919 RepID=A0A1M6PIM6_9FIRM|nr:sensor histidine kinase [Geosporobacter subterraneus]SHK07798.1 Signal transduction histidine kinase [Geosporobacter subterraneus DSM 17957]